MADDPTPEPGDDPTPPPEPSPAPTGPAGEKLADDHPLVTAYKATKAELAAAQRKVKEAEDRDKTELQRATDLAAENGTKATTAEGRALRLEVAIEKGLTLTQAKRLVGDTKEALEADADELLASFRTDDETPPSGGRRPKERLRSGAVPDAPPADPSDPAELVKGIPRT